MTPDPITPDQAAPFVAWWKVIVSVGVGVPAVLGVVVSGVNYLVDERIEDLMKDMEDNVVELAQTVVDDDIEFQDRKMELLEKRVERLEDE